MLNVDPKSRPIKQRKGKFLREKNEVIKIQYTILKEMKIIREVDYPTWLSNVVVVKESYGSLRICVAYIDSNNFPKDCFPLPSID